MHPTPKLRWYRQFTDHGVGYTGTAPVLQQWWEPKNPQHENMGEWRDVPMHVDPYKPVP